MAAPFKNLNAEKWTLEEATKLFNDAIKLIDSKDSDYDFIGEVARDLGTNRHLFNYLSEKFETLKDLHKQILATLEANCFYHTKKETINVATGIVNLKSNYKWTDRNQTDVTTGGDKINPIRIELIDSAKK